MKTTIRIVSTSILSLMACASLADTIQLADGTVIEGDLVGTSNGVVMFNTGDSVEAYPESEVVGIFGAKTGAKVGLGASILTGGGSINVPAGTLLETSLRVPLQIN
jgi:hypothetical protein